MCVSACNRSASLYLPLNSCASSDSLPTRLLQLARYYLFFFATPLYVSLLVNVSVMCARGCVLISLPELFPGLFYLFYVALPHKGLASDTDRLLSPSSTAALLKEADLWLRHVGAL